MSRSLATRRDFLRTGVGVAAAAAVPYTWTSSHAKAQDKNDRPTVACIGVGGMGRGDGRSASRFADIVACADVDKSHAEQFAALRTNCKASARSIPIIVRCWTAMTLRSSRSAHPTTGTRRS